MTAFGEDLARARATIVRGPADAVIAVLMDEFGIAEDPRAGIGCQDWWYLHRWIVDHAIRVMVQGFGMTQQDAARRMGYAPSRAGNAWRPPFLEPDELDLYDAAVDRLGRAA